MFSLSTQKKFWTFSNKEELNIFRINANNKYLKTIDKGEKSTTMKEWLTPDEEFIVVKHYEKCLRDFLQTFKPKNEQLPKDVKGTSFHFYKRFFLVSSVMDYHPKEIIMTCVFLSCKLCEYIMPIDVFAKSIGTNQKLVKNIILDQEMELLYRMSFRLNIYLPHRPIEGLMIDLKTRSSLKQPERLYEHINRFMATMWFTDVCLLYSPALIALAAVMHAVSRCKENIDDFVVHTLLNCPPKSKLDSIITTVREIRSTVMKLEEFPSKEKITQLEAKLAICRNPHNDPSSQAFKTRMLEYELEAYGN